MLNGAYSIGTPDVAAHLAEEIPYPQMNVPIAIGLQISIGFVTGLCYLIAILYAINDLDALYGSPFPLAEIYVQATGSTSAAIGLLCIILFCITLTLVGAYVTAGRTLWALARDNATPFSGPIAKVNTSLHMPLLSTIMCGVLVTILGW